MGKSKAIEEPTQPVRQAEVRTMPLLVALTDAEVAIRAQESASAESELYNAETKLTRYVEEAKEGKASIQNEITDARHQVHRLAEAVRPRKELREVVVVEQSDFDAGAVHTVRTDTGEVVATRGMSQEERQRPLAFVQQARA